jgi:hypothetical protein
MSPTALQHAMDLPWTSLVQRHTQPTALRGTPCDLDLGWQRLPVVEDDPAPQSLEIVIRHHPVSVHEIGARDAVTRMQ